MSSIGSFDGGTSSTITGSSIGALVGKRRAISSPRHARGGDVLFSIADGGGSTILNLGTLRRFCQGGDVVVRFVLLPSSMERVRVTVQEGYSRWAATYDAYPNALIALEEPIVRELVGSVAGRRVLDVGCGTGRHLEWLARAGARVVGVEPNAAMADVARAKCAALGVELCAGDLARLPVDGLAFDVVVCALVLEHVNDLGAAIRELARPLAPGGALVVSAYHPFFLLKGVPPHFASKADDVEYEMPAHVHLPSEYLRALRAARLDLEEMLEPVVDEALVARLPNMAKHLGHPLALVFKALAREGLRGED